MMPNPASSPTNPTKFEDKRTSQTSSSTLIEAGEQKSNPFENDFASRWKRAWGSLVAGKNPRLEKRIWFTVATLAGLVFSLLPLTGCATSWMEWPLTRVDRALLARAAANATELPLETLDHPDLPKHWSWGMAGVCATYEAGDRQCVHEFVCTIAHHDIIHRFLRIHDESDDRVTVTSTWDEAIKKLGIDGGPSGGPLHENRSLFVSHMIVTTSLICLSLLFSLLILLINAIAPWGRKSRRAAVMYTMSFVNAMIMFAAWYVSGLAVAYGPLAVALYGEAAFQRPRHAWAEASVSLALAMQFMFFGIFRPLVALFGMMVVFCTAALSWPSLGLEDLLFV